MFRSNVLPPSSRFKLERSKQQLLDDYFLGLLFDPEDGGITFLWNVSEHLPDYTASRLRKSKHTWCLQISHVAVEYNAQLWYTSMHYWYTVACLAYSTLKMEAIGSSGTLVNFYQTTWRHIPEGSTLHNHRHNPTTLTQFVITNEGKPKEKKIASCLLLVSVLGSLFDLEDGSRTFSRNIGGRLLNYKELQLRRSYFSSH
jgi:hypothetical protein